MVIEDILVLLIIIIWFYKNINNIIYFLYFNLDIKSINLLMIVCFKVFRKLIHDLIIIFIITTEKGKEGRKNEMSKNILKIIMNIKVLYSFFYFNFIIKYIINFFILN